MSFTIPPTRYTKAVVVAFSRSGVIVAYIWNLGTTTPGDAVEFFNRHGYSSHTFGERWLS